MLSPNTDQLTQERLKDLGLSATGNPRPGTARQPLDIPQITGAANLPLRWGEWLRIAVTATLAAAVAIEAIFVMMSAIWFDDLRHALLPFVPLVLTLFIAALVMRLLTRISALRGAETPFFVVGIVVTALVLIRLFAVSGLALGDWSWLASFAHIADPTAEQPHTEIGMIGVSFLAWIIGLRLARHGGDYEKRRAAFLGFFVLLIVAVIVTLLVVGDGRDMLSSALAVMLPIYLFLGLFTLGQVRLAEVQHRVMSTTVSRRQVMLWRLMTAALALVAILFVILAGLIFYTRSYTQALDIVINILGVVVLFILTILFWVIAPIISLLANLRRPTGPSARACAPTPTSGGTPAATTPSVTGTPTPTPCSPSAHIPLSQPSLPIPPAALYGIILLVVIAATLIIAYLFLRRRQGDDVGDEYEEIQENLNMRAIRKERQGAGAANIGAAPAPGTVRAAYRDLLRNSAAVGLARHDDETAAEFAQRIVPAVLAATPAPPLAAEHLTTAYHDERYGAVEPTPDRFAQAQAWALALTGRLASWYRVSATRKHNRDGSAITATLATSARSRLPRGNALLACSIILLALEPVYFTFVGAYRPAATHDVAAGMAMCLIGLLTILMPIGVVICAFITLDAGKIRRNIVVKLLANVCIFAGLIILVPSLFVGVGLILKGLSMIVG